MIEKFIKLGVLAFVGIIVGSFAIGLVSGAGIGGQFDQNGIFPGYNNGSQVNHNGMNMNPQDPQMQQYMQQNPYMQMNPNMQMNTPGNMPGMNVQENMNMRMQTPGMNMQMNKSESMNNMNGMGMMNMKMGMGMGMM